MTREELIAKYKEITLAILSSGPDIQDTINDIGIITAAAERIYIRAAKRFGLRAALQGVSEEQWKELSLNSEVVSLEEKLLAAAVPRDPNKVVAASDFGHTAGLPTLGTPLKDRQGWRDIFSFLISHPELLTLLLSFLKAKQPTG